MGSGFTVQGFFLLIRVRIFVKSRLIVFASRTRPIEIGPRIEDGSWKTPVQLHVEGLGFRVQGLGFGNLKVGFLDPEGLGS